MTQTYSLLGVNMLNVLKNTANYLEWQSLMSTRIKTDDDVSSNINSLSSFKDKFSFSQLLEE